MPASTQTNRTLGGLPYKWTVGIVVILGLFMVVLDSTIVNIAIPRLQTDFGAPLTSVQWVSTGYTLAQAVATPLTPFLSERLGLKQLYLLALAFFTLGSALCGLAWSLPVLSAFRIVQGAGGAPLLPLAFTLVFREFPPQERGAATGALGIPVLLAPALGPTIGGYIVTSIGWPLIFYLNVPIGIVGLLMGYFFLREYRPGGTSHFDLPGFVFSAIGLAAVLYALSDVSTDGWGSTTVLGFLAGGILSLAIFVVAELITANDGGEPLLDIRTLTVKVGDFVSKGEVIGTVKIQGSYATESVKAKFSGIIVQVPGAIGQIVGPGVAIAQEVDPSSIKITAYVDESAINNISLGQLADIHVDAYSGTTFSGHVNQIVGAAASTFSLLPTQDNASGNFTKVSQRIPVNILLDGNPDFMLLPGMSTEVTIHLHGV